MTENYIIKFLKVEVVNFFERNDLVLRFNLKFWRHLLTFA